MGLHTTQVDKHLAGKMWRRYSELECDIRAVIAEEFDVDAITVIRYLKDFEENCEGDCCMECKYGLKGSPIAGGYDE